jgi:hypothetical protein
MTSLGANSGDEKLLLGLGTIIAIAIAAALLIAAVVLYLLCRPKWNYNTMYETEEDQEQNSGELQHEVQSVLMFDYENPVFEGEGDLDMLPKSLFNESSGEGDIGAVRGC